MRTSRKGIEKHAPVLGPHHGSDLHASRRRGRSDSVTLRMYARTRRMLGWDIPLLDPGLDHGWDQQSARLDIAAWCRIYVAFVFTTQRRVVTVVRGVDRRCMHDTVSSLGCDVDSLDGTVKGDGETDDDADATWACGRGA